MEIVRLTVLSYGDNAGIRETSYTIAEGEGDESKTRRKRFFSSFGRAGRTRVATKTDEPYTGFVKKKKNFTAFERLVPRRKLINREIRTNTIIWAYRIVRY